MRPDGSIDLVLGLRPLGRLYIYARALLEFARTTTITLTIEIQERGPVVTHDGEIVEPDLDYELEEKELPELVKRVPIRNVRRLIELAQDRLIEPYVADDEAKTCTRPAPHICKVNGPCNGFPRDSDRRAS